MRDTLDVISGKWKLQVILSIWNGNTRFKEIQRSIPKLTTKVLSQELKNLEENKLIKRTVYEDSPLQIQYTLEPYTDTLLPLIRELINWGRNHRVKIFGDPIDNSKAV